MFWKRRWAAIMLVVLAQLVILLCYRLYLTEPPTPSAESTPRVVLTDARPQPSAPTPSHQSTEGEPRVLPALLQPPAPAPVTPSRAEIPEPDPMPELARHNTAGTVPPVPTSETAPQIQLPMGPPPQVGSPQAAVPAPPAPTAPPAPSAAAIPVEPIKPTPPAPPPPVVTTTLPETPTTTTPPIPAPAPPLEQLRKDSSQQVNKPELGRLVPQPEPDSPTPRPEPTQVAPPQMPPTSAGSPPSGVSEEALKAVAVPLVGKVEPRTDKPPQPIPGTEVGPCPWTLRIELIKGRSHLTAQIKDEVQFRIRCDKLDLQAPRGNIHASGSVAILSEGLEATCDHLTIAWSEDAVLLDGQAHLKCRRDGQSMEMKAPKLSLRLSVAQGGLHRTGDRERNQPLRGSTIDTSAPPFGGYEGSSEPSSQPPTPQSPHTDRPKSPPNRRTSDW